MACMKHLYSLCLCTCKQTLGRSRQFQTCRSLQRCCKPSNFSIKRCTRLLSTERSKHIHSALSTNAFYHMINTRHSRFQINALNPIKLVFIYLYNISLFPCAPSFFLASLLLCSAFLSGKGCKQRHVVALCTHTHGLAKQKGEKRRAEEQELHAE